MPSPNNGQPTPPSGYQLDVTPPEGYTLDNVPTFLQQGIDMSRVQQVNTTPSTEEDRESAAKVEDINPYKIEVLSPDLYGDPIRNHELTHTYQLTRSKDLPPIFSPTPEAHVSYDYGGVKGLQEATTQHKTISDFNAEQQAEIVKDYKVYHDQYLVKAASGKITPFEEREMYQVQKTYHPFIKQLASMPGEKVSLKRSPLLELLGIQKPVDIDRRPEPPGLPPYDEPGLGVLPADPLMGGKSQTTPYRKPPKAYDSFDSGPLAGVPIPGLVKRGNVDVNHRPIIWNTPNDPSTIYSATIPVDEKGNVWTGNWEKAPRYALVPTIANGKFLVPGHPGNEERGEDPEKFYGSDGKPIPLEKYAVKRYSITKEHLGIFSTREAADEYADETHAWMPTGGPEKVYHPSYEGESNMPLNQKEYEAEIIRRKSRETLKHEHKTTP